MSRYAIYEGSISAHCCFEFTVVDTEKPTMLGGEHYRHWRTGELMYEQVCECFDREQAELICNALNAGCEVIIAHDEVFIGPAPKAEN